MKNQILKILLLSIMSTAAFAQKQPISFEWPQRRVMAGIDKVFSLGEQGTLFFEQVALNSMSAAMKLSYVSADGKRTWTSDDIKIKPLPRNIVWSDEGFTVYQMDYAKKAVGFWHFNYKGEVTGKGEVKYNYPVFAFIRSSDKMIGLMDNDDNDNPQIYIQEVNPVSFQPIGSQKMAELPAGKRIGVRRGGLYKPDETAENRWVLAGAEGNRLLFYGKKIMLKSGTVHLEVVLCDVDGKKLDGFSTAVELGSGLHVNRTFKSQQHIRRRLWKNEFFSSEGDVQMGIRAYGNDVGTFGECMVDWNQSAIYYYGSYGTKPEDGKTPVSGYFIQKYSFKGEKRWSTEAAFRSRDILEGININDEAFYINPKNGHILYRHMPTVTCLNTDGSSILEAVINTDKVKSELASLNLYELADNSDFYGFYHQELVQTPLLSKLFEEKAAAALQSHIEKNGSPASWYVIQANADSFLVFETNPASKAYTVWTVHF